MVERGTMEEKADALKQADEYKDSDGARMRHDMGRLWQETES